MVNEQKEWQVLGSITRYLLNPRWGALCANSPSWNPHTIRSKSGKFVNTSDHPERGGAVIWLVQTLSHPMALIKLPVKVVQAMLARDSVCTRDGTGSEPLTRDPTRPDPTRTLFTRWPDAVDECVCFELRDYFDDGVLLVNAFCQKSLVYAAHIQITKMSNIIVNLLSI